jgi:hypothetical protein
MSPIIRTIARGDWTAWEPLFKAYIDFYKTSIPAEQYEKTFNRLVDPDTDLYGLVMTDDQDQSKLLAIAHYFPRQTPWSEKKVMHLNGPFPHFADASTDKRFVCLARVPLERLWKDDDTSGREAFQGNGLSSPRMGDKSR